MSKRARARSGGRPFTVEFPVPLDARKEGDAWFTEVEGHDLRLSNLTKVFWPNEGYTKGDLIAYYASVADLIGPHLRGRPLTMKRMPDGAEGPFFYEKTAPSHTPEWIHRCKVLSEDAKTGVIDYLVVDDAATLLYVANLGCIEMHPLHSRCEDVEHPDYLFFDLDPFPPYTYGQVRAFVGACGRMIARADPDRVTMAWRVADRAGKVFIDHNMNRQGANIAAVYSLRPEPRATVSTPLTWDEVEAGGFEPSDFRI